MEWLPLVLSAAALVVALAALRVAWRTRDISTRQWHAALNMKGLGAKGPQSRWQRPPT